MTAASRALNKIRCHLPAKIAKELGQIEDRVAIKLAAASPPESSADVYETNIRVLGRGIQPEHLRY